MYTARISESKRASSLPSSLLRGHQKVVGMFLIKGNVLLPLSLSARWCPVNTDQQGVANPILLPVFNSKWNTLKLSILSFHEFTIKDLDKINYFQGDSLQLSLYNGVCNQPTVALSPGEITDNLTVGWKTFNRPFAPSLIVPLRKKKTLGKSTSNNDSELEKRTVYNWRFFFISVAPSKNILGVMFFQNLWEDECSNIATEKICTCWIEWPDLWQLFFPYQMLRKEEERKLNSTTKHQLHIYLFIC